MREVISRAVCGVAVLDFLGVIELSSVLVKYLTGVQSGNMRER